MRTTLASAACLFVLAACGAPGQEPQTAAQQDPAPKASPQGFVPATPTPQTSTPTREPRQQTDDATRRPEPEPKPARRQHDRDVRRYAVLDVIDGDTVEVAYRGGVSVRVIGIDTPETVHPSEPVECGGPQASATASRLLAGKRVRLVFDRSQGRLDAYGRTLAYLQVPRLGDFGLAMIRKGRAAEYTYDTAYARQALYRSAQAHARSEGRGLWKTCGGIDTPLAQPAPVPQPQGGGACDPGYDPCIPPYPPDLDCDDVDGPLRVTGDDLHGFDADGDGTGCDS